MCRALTQSRHPWATLLAALPTVVEADWLWQNPAVDCPAQTLRLHSHAVVQDPAAACSSLEPVVHTSNILTKPARGKQQGVENLQVSATVMMR